jgi:hypothetical protein
MAPPALVEQPYPAVWDKATHRHDLTANVADERLKMPWDECSHRSAMQVSSCAEPGKNSRSAHAEEVEELDALLSAVYPLIRKYEEENASPDDTRVIE